MSSVPSPSGKCQVHSISISQSYPYSSESEEARASVVATAFEGNEGLEDKIAAESTPLGESAPGANGAPVKWWTWVCPECIEGRLHIAGYAVERHGLITVCDGCGSTFPR